LVLEPPTGFTLLLQSLLVNHCKEHNRNQRGTSVSDQQIGRYIEVLSSIIPQ
jgi:hypothetical protein